MKSLLSQKRVEKQTFLPLANIFFIHKNRNILSVSWILRKNTAYTWKFARNTNCECSNRFTLIQRTLPSSMDFLKLYTLLVKCGWVLI